MRSQPLRSCLPGRFLYRWHRPRSNTPPDTVSLRLTTIPLRKSCRRRPCKSACHWSRPRKNTPPDTVSLRLTMIPERKSCRRRPCTGSRMKSFPPPLLSGRFQLGRNTVSSQTILLAMSAQWGKGYTFSLQLQSMYQEGMKNICCPLLAFSNPSNNCQNLNCPRRDHRTLVIDQTKIVPRGKAIRQEDLDKVPMFSSNTRIWICQNPNACGT